MRNELEILIENDDFVVVNKPFDVKINSDNDEEVTVETLLRQRGVRCKDTTGKALRHSYHWVHRLDYATSGILCIGLSKLASRIAQRAFEERRVCKYYVALVRGHVDLNHICGSCGDVSVVASQGNVEQYLEIRASLVRDRTTDFPYIFSTNLPPNVSCDGTTTDQSQGSSRYVSGDKVLSALTAVHLLETGYYDGDKASKLLLVPHTGRSHQLRVHCSHIGHTIVGDYTYSRREDLTPPRMMLHACSLYIPASPLPDIQVTTTDPFNTDIKWVCEVKRANVEQLMGELKSRAAGVDSAKTC